MAKSPRTAAPCSASPCLTCTSAYCTDCEHYVDEPAAPTPIDHRPLMSLRAIIDTISGVDGAIAGLCELLDAAGGSRIYAAHIKALLAPVSQQLSDACDDLNDHALLAPVHPQFSEAYDDLNDLPRMAPGEVLLSAPQKLTYEFFTTCGACGLSIEGEGFTQTLTRFHVPYGDARYWNLGHWLSTEARTDHLGKKWHTYGTYITDDFGTLVAMKGGAA